MVEAKDKPRGNDDKSKIEQQTDAQILVKLAQENAEIFFKDQYGAECARVRIADHFEVMALDRSKFRFWLMRLFSESAGGRIVGQEALNSAIDQLRAQAHFSGNVFVLHLRVAWTKKGEEILYDRTNEEWEYVHITKEG